MTPEEVVLFLEYLRVDNAYLFPQPCRDDPSRWKAVSQFLFTWGVVTGDMGDRVSVRDRWCYHTAADALIALSEWDGTGEPHGWHRHPNSGRRRVVDEVTGEVVEIVRD